MKHSGLTMLAGRCCTQLLYMQLLLRPLLIQNKCIEGCILLLCDHTYMLLPCMQDAC